MSVQRFHAHGWRVTVQWIDALDVFKWSVSNPITGRIKWMGEATDIDAAKKAAAGFAATKPRHGHQGELGDADIEAIH